MKLATLLTFPLCLIGLQDIPAPHELPQAVPLEQIDASRLALAVLDNRKYIQIFIGDCAMPPKHYPRARDSHYNFQACMFGPAILQRISYNSRNVCWRGDNNYDYHVDMRDWHEGLVGGWGMDNSRYLFYKGEMKFWLMGHQEPGATRLEIQADGTTVNVWDGRSR